MNRRYTIVFAAFAISQFVGTVVPVFTNIHSNIWPFFALLLLIPGIVVPAILFPSLPYFGTAAVAVTVNAVVWYLSLRWWPK